MITDQIIRPEPPDPAWEADLADLNQDAVRNIQQGALQRNPFRAVRFLAAVTSEALTAEDKEEGRLWLNHEITALWPLRNDRRFRPSLSLRMFHSVRSVFHGL